MKTSYKKLCAPSLSVVSNLPLGPSFRVECGLSHLQWLEILCMSRFNHVPSGDTMRRDAISSFCNNSSSTMHFCKRGPHNKRKMSQFRTFVNQSYTTALTHLPLSCCNRLGKWLTKSVMQNILSYPGSL